MKTNRCVKCMSDFKADYKSNVCETCETPKEFGFPRIEVVEFLMKGTKDQNKSSKAEIAELKRNILIPNKDGHNYACRIGENGKIQEKSISV